VPVVKNYRRNYLISILIFKKLNKKRNGNLKLDKTLSYYLKDYNTINSFNTIFNSYKLKKKEYNTINSFNTIFNSYKLKKKEYNTINSFNTILTSYKLKNKDYEKVIYYWILRQFFISSKNRRNLHNLPEIIYFRLWL